MLRGEAFLVIPTRSRVLLTPSRILLRVLSFTWHRRGSRAHATGASHVLYLFKGHSYRDSYPKLQVAAWTSVAFTGVLS